MFNRNPKTISAAYDPVLPEPKWAKRISTIHPLLFQAMVVFGSAAAAIAGAERLPIAILCGVVAFFGLVLGRLRDSRKKVLEQERRASQMAALESIVRELTQATQDVGDTLSVKDHTLREIRLNNVRRSILAMVKDRLGPGNGVRVNLFLVTNTDPVELRAASWAHDSRQSQRSNRVFTPADESLRLAMRLNEGRYESDTTELKGEEFAYECFATMPVSSADKLYGLLTVDAPEADDIDHFEATVLLNQFASLLALTFISDAQALAVPVGENAQHFHPLAMGNAEPLAITDAELVLED
ncbi:hypothetical protein [Corynebacterium sp.]|uniref:hypothetical protein n=1 Tax=Corynebacterium sp. TaxID=1720 RepID=UPI0026DCECF7|nr:hypothetical protein [Corynebacterium sp.]MDO5077714.1 hypothetical protein [Corynebacterium sp.]